MKRSFLFVISALVLIGFTSCKGGSEKELVTLSGLSVNKFTQDVKGKEGKFFVLKNSNGMEVCISNLGARIVSVMVPDKTGAMKDVVLGFDSVKDYETIPNNFGATIGRYANRIGNGIITVDSVTYQLPKNNYGHCLHGGPTGWSEQVFDSVQYIDNKSVVLSIVSPDGDANFPGTVSAQVAFTLTDDNAIDIRYSATTDKKTVINMTNHSYFNLSGDPSLTAVDNILYLNANEYTPVDSSFMTTGEILPVAGTPMDFTTPKVISHDIDKTDFIQLKYGRGYDHNWVLNTKGNDKEVAARLTSPVSGITLEVYTDEPGLQVYTGNFLDGTVTGKKGIVYNLRSAVCLETQKFPDTPNKPQWPSAVLEPGKEYTSHTIYKFSVEK
ncbi:MAG: galactose mutarotase [Bacteroidales bacterium]|nr:galactose mutarotase [Bacteroidales bacterium]MDD4821266.1 galactose mutarotase [Bacteroidales bacterium]